VIFIACTTCGFTLQVEGSIKDENRELDSLVGESSSFWPDNYTCADCGGQAVGLKPGGFTDRATTRLRIVEVTVQEAFAALQGLGLPKERSCRFDDVLELIKQYGVKAVIGQDIRGTDRCVIDYFILGDGSKMYVGSSAGGATIYRITRPHFYVEEVSRG
jgi:hypothetical protein